MPRGFVVWFTGLSGSGKSTLTTMLAAELRGRGVHVETLDGDEVRKHLSKGLGFSRSDRDANIRRIGFVAKLVARSGGCAIAAAISPYREIRDELRRSIDHFCEVYTECPLTVLSDRDPKGLYKKALAGEIKNFTGVDDPYQAPDAPEVHLHTDLETPAESVARILARLEALGLLSTEEGPRSSPPPNHWRGLPSPHGNELIDRLRRGDLVTELAAQAEKTPSVTLSEDTQVDLAAIATGLYSPLTGFVTSKDHRRILDAMRLETGLPWALPVSLDVPEARFDELRAAERVALRDAGGRLLAVLSVQDLWRPDRQREAEALFGTADPSHPGVARLARRGPVYLGGLVECLDVSIPTGRGPLLDPHQTREALLPAKGTRAVGFPTSAPPTRGDEHALRAALDVGDTVVCALGSGADDEVPVSVRIRCFEAMLRAYFGAAAVSLGSYPRPRHVDPRRLALHDAIVSRNLGCSRLLLRGDATGAEPLPHAFELDVSVVRSERVTWSTRVGQPVSEHSAPAEPDARAADELRPEVTAVLAAAGRGPR